MTFKSSTFCPLPWVGINPRTDASLTTCCLSSQTLSQVQAFPNQAILDSEVRNSTVARDIRVSMLAGQQPPNCDQCWMAERAGLKSMRLYNLEWSNFTWNDAVNSTQSDGSFYGPLEYYDIRPGNRCNLKCRMCSVDYSSAWQRDHELIFGETADQSGKNFDWARSPEAWDRIFTSVRGSLRDLDQVWIGFAGGEPLLANGHAEFLRNCIKHNIASKIHLRYTSNLTHIPSELANLWQSFAHVLILVSIDGLGEANDYIRYPSSWANIERNLNVLLELDWVQVAHQPCVSIYNVYSIPELLNWAATLVQSFRGNRVEVPSCGHVVHYPDQLNIRNLPRSVKCLLEDSFMTFSGKTRDQEFLKGLIDYWSADSSSEGMDTFWIYNDKLDRIRKQSFSSVFPHWNRILATSSNGTKR